MKISNLFLLSFLLTLNFTINAQSVEKLNERANKCFEIEDYECAEMNILKMIKKDKKREDKSRYYTDLGTAQRRMGKIEEAMASYNTAIEINSTKAVYFTNRATLKQQTNDREGALEDYLLALEADNMDKAARINCAALLGELGEYEKGFETLAVFSENNPDDIHAAMAMCGLIRDSGDLEGAIKGYTELIEKNPKSGRLYNSRADTYLRMEKYEEGMVDANHSIKLDRNYPYAQTTKGEILLALGQVEAACKQFHMAIELGLNPADLEEEMKAHCNH